ncbi:hypothetical protein CEUSTIGMA_g2713.t1 [Chlamydomonas eustigma]|uniref:Reverse transcriptase Ty1/copia-type domain-containing protein n=1 Tax=Chlamydomonas eustigma TaxID=1157962 RepID=A0A250WWQ2_9CHLO|nr:hypothetical protein CEUSTIGMA_g2713.t1 [Chlamydomonas eustigma]|eukprot:GAX75268.1 hypothetical protein CEUSTIGMA_g2713.t1 [Chlamydomonas eustigma]
MSVMRYLQITQHFGLEFGGEKHKDLVGFSDSSYSSDVDTKRSTTGYVFTYNGGVVSWSSRLQRTVAVSTIEAEYMAASAVAKEALWLRKLMCELQVSKHIDTMHHFVRERIQMRQLTYQYISTADMVADILTKATEVTVFHKMRDQTGLVEWA